MKSTHLNYIGSKHTLLEWLSSQILQTTGWESFQDKHIGDLFSGTGVVSFHFRCQGSIVSSNDIELCSYIVTKAMTECCFTLAAKEFLETMNNDISEDKHTTVGFITRQYSPFEGCERMFFTVDNAKRIDYVRRCIETASLNESEKVFALASLLVSADSIANCTSVYGAYLKKFKRVAEKPFVLRPIHTCEIQSQGTCFNENILNPEFLRSLDIDLLYLDPPYNERQYSKNYFPLSVLAMRPDQQDSLVLSGKTGIPGNCFNSPFCSKKTVLESFETVLTNTKAKWTFISYNSESLLDKNSLLNLLQKYGKAKLVEKSYKRFQSQKEEKQEIKEYLFSLERQ